MKLWLTCSKCGQTAHEDNWGVARKCPYCGLVGNYNSSVFPPRSGKIVIQKQEGEKEQKAPNTFDQFEAAQQAIKQGNNEPVWKCGNCNKFAPKSKWIEGKYKCPHCGSHSIKYEVKPEQSVVAQAAPQPQSTPVVSQQSAEKPAQKEPQTSVQQEPEEEERTGKKNSWKRPIIILVICLIIVGLIMRIDRTLSTVPQVAVDTVVVTEAPTDQLIISSTDLQASAIDVKSSDYIKTEQIIIILLSLIIILAGWLDRKMSNQILDAIVAVVLVVIVLFGASQAIHFIASGLVSVIPVDLPTAWWIMSFVITVVSLVAVVLVSVYGTVDLTPVGMFFGLLGLVGGVLLGHLGSLQEVLRIPSGQLFPIGEVFLLVRAKQFEIIKFSLLVYGCLTIGILTELREILKPYAKSHVISFAGLIISPVCILMYVLLRMFGDLIPVVGTLLSSPYGALLVFLALNLVAAAVLRERVDNMFGNTSAEYKLGQARAMSPWDIILFQAALGGFLIILVGKV